jgi:cytochrome b pre-mRNA-processing protein 3
MNVGMLNFLDWFRSRSADGRTAAEIYGSIVAQARHPAFYADLGVADVAEKRYELLVLHLSLVLERLRGRGEREKAVAQGLVEEFVRDIDGSMREMAVGDTSVPRKVRKAAGGFYDRDALYRQAFDGAEDMTPTALIDELIFDGHGGLRAEQVTRYVAVARQGLADWSAGAGETGLPPFPARVVGE